VTSIYLDDMLGEHESGLIDDAFAARTNRGPILQKNPSETLWDAWKHPIPTGRNDRLWIRVPIAVLPKPHASAAGFRVSGA
jgi:hypothetical protein